MMSKTGIKKQSAGFTLIEVMAAAAILTLGTVAVFQANLINMNVYGRYVNRLAIQNWAEQKIWEAKEAIFLDDFSNVGETSGQVAVGTKTYEWTLATKENASNAIGSNSLYEITLNVSWPEGGQTSRLMRNSFLIKIKRS